MILILACAAAVATGAACGAFAILPRRRPLRAELDELLGPDPSSSRTAPGFLSSFPSQLTAALSIDGQRFPQLFRDLAVTGETADAFVRQILLAAGVFTTLALLVVGAVSIEGFAVGAGIGLGSALVAGGFGAVLPRLILRGQAEEHRGQMREAVAVICDLAAVLVAAGEDVDAAVVAAANAGAGWAFEAVQSRLPRSGRLGTWVVLERLGDELGVEELVVLAQNMGLAEEKGAKVRDALNIQARTLREEAASEVEARAGSMTERMSFPMVMLLAGFLLVIGYPAVARL